MFDMPRKESPPPSPPYRPSRRAASLASNARSAYAELSDPRAPVDSRLWVSSGPDALLATRSEPLLQSHLSQFQNLADLDAARNALQNAACIGRAMLCGDRPVHGQLLGWPIVIQPSQPTEWTRSYSFGRDPAQPAFYDHFLAAWRRPAWTTPVELCRRRVVLPFLLDSELAFDGNPLPPSAAVQHAANLLMNVQPKEPFRMYRSSAGALRTLRRPLVVLAPAVVFGAMDRPLPMVHATAADCRAMGDLVGGLFHAGPRLRQVLVHPPLPWRQAVRAAQDIQIQLSIAHGLTHDQITLRDVPAQPFAPWERVRHRVTFTSFEEDCEEQFEEETWNYPAWWQPSDHLTVSPTPHPVGWVAACATSSDQTRLN